MEATPKFKKTVASKMPAIKNRDINNYSIYVEVFQEIY